MNPVCEILFEIYQCLAGITNLNDNVVILKLHICFHIIPAVFYVTIVSFIIIMQKISPTTALKLKFR